MWQVPEPQQQEPGRFVEVGRTDTRPPPQDWTTRGRGQNASAVYAPIIRISQRRHMFLCLLSGLEIPAYRVKFVG